MTNEALFFIRAVIDLGFVLFLFRFGKAGLLAGLIINLVLVSIFGAQLIPFFYFVTNTGNVFYAATFLSMNILLEHFGKKDAYRFVWIGFFALILFSLMTQLTLLHVSSPETISVNQTLKAVFMYVPRITFASLVAYLCAHLLNIWLYDLVHKSSGRKHLWIRSMGSQFVAQALDSLIFFSLAFSGTMAFSKLIEVMLTGFTLKVEIALLSTPFLYLSYKLIKK